MFVKTFHFFLIIVSRGHINMKGYAPFDKTPKLAHVDGIGRAISYTMFRSGSAFSVILRFLDIIAKAAPLLYKSRSNQLRQCRVVARLAHIGAADWHIVGSLAQGCHTRPAPSHTLRGELPASTYSLCCVSIRLNAYTASSTTLRIFLFLLLIANFGGLTA